MADYDVGALALTVPPAKAVITSYRPAVSVRNNGIHDALASGTLRIYKAGLLVFTTEIYSPTIPPGETKAATATDYWTPPSVGAYQAIAYVSCPLDQYEPNNSLPPTLVTVTAEPPPPAPTVALHASQHEDGGTDELSIDGLGGRAKDPQVPFDHVSNHETGGSDLLDVTGLHGQLADGQPAAIHGNEKHAPPFATYANISEAVNAHDAFATVHAASTNLEHVANKGSAYGYPSLDSGTKVPPAQLGGQPQSDDLFLRADQSWQPAAAGQHDATHETGGTYVINVGSLRGVLYEHQLPKIHASEAHSQTLEDQANKGAASGYAPLDAGAKVPVMNLGGADPATGTFLKSDQSWALPDGGIPASHKSTHQTAGADELSVAGLHGQLGDLQPVKAHHDSHAAGGSDEITVAGLQGVLAEPQSPASHTAIDHDTSVEATAHKGAANGYCELDAGALVPVARIPAGPVPAHAVSHQDGGSDELSIAGLSGKLADAQTPLNHGATHMHEGGDDISIGGLSGMPAAAGVALGLATLDLNAKLTDYQRPPPNSHGNESHSKPFQPTEEKGQTGGYCPLDGQGKVDQIYLPLCPIHAPTHEAGAGDEIDLTGMSGLLATAQTPTGHANTHNKNGTDPLDTGMPVATMPGHVNSYGAATYYVRKDHRHRSPGGIDASKAHVIVSDWNAEGALFKCTINANILSPRSTLRIRSHGYLYATFTHSHMFDFNLRFGPDTEPLNNQLILQCRGAIDGSLTGTNRIGYVFEGLLNVCTASTGRAWGSLIIGAQDAGLTTNTIVIPIGQDIEIFNPVITNCLSTSVVCLHEDQGCYGNISYCEDVFMGEDAQLYNPYEPPEPNPPQP